MILSRENGTRYRTVGEFYRNLEDLVEVVDLWGVLPQLKSIGTFDDVE